MLDTGNEIITTTDGLSLYCQWQRVENARAVILIVHGVGEHAARYQPFESWFCDHGYSCYGYDQRGHGRSGGVRTHVNNFLEYAEDLQLIISKIHSENPTLPVFLFSHSMGTLVALTNSIVFPDTKLAGIILSSCAIMPGRSLPSWALKLTHPLARFVPRLRVPTFIPVNSLSHDAAVIDSYKYDELVEGTVTLGWLRSFSDAQKEIFDKVDRIRVPLLVLHSRADPIASIDGVRDLLASVKSEDVTFIEFQSLFHELHNEVQLDREQVFKNIFDWCAERGYTK